MSEAPLLVIEDLEVKFTLRRESLFKGAPLLHAVDGVSLAVARGRTIGLVGESGSGKTTTALAVARLAPTTAGSITLDGVDILALDGEALRQHRQHVQIIFQDPYSALNPRLRAGAIVREPLDRLAIGTPEERGRRVDELFSQVGLRPEQQRLFPHQFSGGQRQRLGIARALASNPSVIICDEPVSALDVAVQAQILNLLRRLQAEFGLTYLFISHDLGVVQHMCDEVAVMYMGKIVEQAEREPLFRQPLHPYTWALISAVPSADPKRQRDGSRIRLEGDPPSPINLPAGCRFAGRCPFAEARCRDEAPAMRQIAPGHRVACHLVSDDGVPPQAAMLSSN